MAMELLWVPGRPHNRRTPMTLVAPSARAPWLGVRSEPSFQSAPEEKLAGKPEFERDSPNEKRLNVPTRNPTMENDEPASHLSLEKTASTVQIASTTVERTSSKTAPATTGRTAWDALVDMGRKCLVATLPGSSS